MKVKCSKCGNIMDVTSLERPLKIRCPVCGTVGVLKEKPPEKQYVPPVSSTPYSSYAPYPAQHPPYSQYPQPPAWYPEKKKTNISLAAGILLIIAGLIAIGTWGFMIIGAGEIASLYGEEEGFISFLRVCATIGIILSVFPILGGIMAVKKTHWGVALAGSIIGLFTIGPWIAISSILSLIALILIAVSKEEFRQSSSSNAKF